MVVLAIFIRKGVCTWYKVYDYIRSDKVCCFFHMSNSAVFVGENNDFVLAVNKD